MDTLCKDVKRTNVRLVVATAYIYELRQFRKRYEGIFEMAKLLNEIYGLAVILSVASCFFEVTAALNSLFSRQVEPLLTPFCLNRVFMYGSKLLVLLHICQKTSESVSWMILLVLSSLPCHILGNGCMIFYAQSH